MNSLTDLKSKYMQQLQQELSSVAKATASFQISMNGVNLLTNASEVNVTVQEASQRINKLFVDELNEAHYEAEFSDEERLRCYNEFRAECGALLSARTNVGLSTDSV